MTDQPRVGQGSPEQVAYRLLEQVAAAEKIELGREEPREGYQAATRDWTLNTYAQCLTVVRSNRFEGNKDRVPRLPSTGSADAVAGY